MSEAHGEPPADVRSFLPRPGEPVEEYAQRLRALHRDLTLVLQAVERGLAAATEPAPRVREPPPAMPPEAPPLPGRATVEVHPREGHRPAGTAPSPPGGEGAFPGMARVEVIAAPAGERRRDDAEDRRQVLHPDRPSSAGGRPEEAPAPAPAGARAGDPTFGSQRLPPRPSAVAPPETEPAWVHRDPVGGSFTAATFGPSAPRPRRGPSPVLIAALVLGWLTVVALALALLLAG